MEDKLEQAKKSYENDDLVQSLDLLNEIIQVDTANVQAFFLRGMIYFRQQKWGESINDFSSVLDLEPDHLVAKTKIEMAKNILGYFSSDMFNP